MYSASSRHSFTALRGVLSSAARSSVHISNSRPWISQHILRASSRSSFVPPLRGLHSSRRLLNEAAGEAEVTTISHEQDGPITTFEELGTKGLVDRGIVNTIVKEMKLETMTEIQSQTIDGCLQGNDVLAQAKTGTGKTLAFLIPTVQNILRENPTLARPSRGRYGDIDVRALIISPTRELAEQISVEARRLVARTGLKVQTAVGGTQKRAHLTQMQREGCHILVGTPGRLNDILSDPFAGVNISNLDTFVLDEADRLLDDGFAPEVNSIHQLLPKERSRQTLMFSATMPQEVLYMVQRFMKQGYKFVKTVQDEEPTHERVPQNVVRLAGMENTFPALVELIQREYKAGKEGGRPFKAIVFLNANSEVNLYYNMFENLGEAGSSRFASHPLYGLTCVAMNSKLTQQQRTRNSELFRRSEQSIMFSSDVTARGMDFPGVTHVIQVGIPQTRESYIHRLGRTGRAGKEGEGWLLVNNVDESEARYRLSGLRIKQNRSLQTSNIDMTQDSQLPAEVSNTLTQAISAAKRTSLTSKYEAWRALFGTHQWFKQKRELVEAFNRLSKYGWGLDNPPALEPGLASKLGFARVRELNTDIGADRDILFQERMDQKLKTQEPLGYSSRDSRSRGSGFRSGGRNDFGRSDSGRRSSGRDFGGFGRGDRRSSGTPRSPAWD